MFQPIPMSGPDLTAAEVEAVHQVITTRFLSFGPYLTEFENSFATRVGARYAVGVSSGTAGLHLAVIAADVGPNDIVITTPFSFVASANCVLYERGIPLFVDIDPQTLNIDPAQVNAAIQDIRAGRPERWLPPALRQTPAAVGDIKAILPVHVFGQPTDMDPLLDMAQTHNLSIIEDACESVGSTYKGRPAGMLGDVGVFAFYPNKQMTTGEGGLIVTDNEDWANLFRSLRNQGRDVFDTWLTHTRLGYNYRLDELSAALGQAQLSRLDTLLSKRSQVANWYTTRLTDIAGVQPPYLTPETTYMSWCLYVVQLDPDLDRNQTMTMLQNQGIPSRAYFSPLHLQPFYRQKFGYQPGDFPVTERVAQFTLALPFFGNMTEAQVNRVCQVLDDVIQQQRV